MDSLKLRGGVVMASGPSVIVQDVPIYTQPCCGLAYLGSARWYQLQPLDAVSRRSNRGKFRLCFDIARVKTEPVHIA